MQEETTPPPFMRLILWSCSLVLFTVGFVQTARGIENYKIAGIIEIIGFENNNYVISGVIFIFLFAGYIIAIKGSKVGLCIYLFCTLINFICNFNYMYSNHISESLIKEELTKHRISFSQLTLKISTTFLDKDALKEQISQKSTELVAEIKDRGIGTRSKAIIIDIENILGTTINLPEPPNRDQNTLNTLAETAKTIVDKALELALAKNNFKLKSTLIFDAKQQQNKIITKIDELLKKDNSNIRQELPDVLNNVVNIYQSLCLRSKSLMPKFKCNENYKASNYKLENFDAYQEAYKHINQLDTIVVIFFTLLIDFILPFICYLLLHQNPHKDIEKSNIDDDSMYPKSIRTLN